MRALARLTAIVICTLALWPLWGIWREGHAGLSWDFISSVPTMAGRAGGILPVLVSTLAVLGLCMVVAVPLSLGTALFLNEWSRQHPLLASWIRKSLDVLAAVPSIVFGLFGNAFFSVWMGLGFSLAAGGLTLACMILPLMIRTIQIGLGGVPREVRFAGRALGLDDSALLLRVILPLALPGALLGLVLGTARAMAETAALLFTAGYVDRMPESILDSGRTLSVHIYELTMNVPGGNPNAQATALVLVVLLMTINLIAFHLGGLLLKRQGQST